MSFGQPLWLWALAFLPLLAALYVRNERRRVKLLRQLVAARLFTRLADTVNLPLRRLRFGLFLLGLAAVMVSLARPRYGYTWEERKQQGRDVIVAIDCSRSMLATDLAPNRLARAKLATQDLIEQLPGDRVGLIAFAGTAFLQAPLTIDYSAVLDSLNEIDTNIIPRGGTNIAAAITEADAAFGKGESDNRCLILFTDGEELESDAVMAAAAEKDHMKIFTVGLGSADGSLIPIPGENGGTTFIRDEHGEFVRSKLDEDRLRKIAESTGGFYLHLQTGPAGMQQIVRDGLGKMKDKEFNARMSRQPIERYHWPLSAALVLLVASTLLGERKTLLGERKRAPRLATPPPLPRAAVAVLLLLMLPLAAQAKNNGIEAYDRGDYTDALSDFDRQLQKQPNSPVLNYNLGTAAYRAGDYEKALQAFAKAVTSSDPILQAAAEYNLANTLFEQGAATEDKSRRMQNWNDALKHYDQALKAAPRSEDAAHNRDVVQKLLEEMKKEQQPPQQQDKKDQKDDKDKKDQQQQQQQGGQQNQQQDQKNQQQPQQGSQGGQQKQDQQQQNQQQQQQAQGGQKDQQPQNQPQQGQQQQAQQKAQSPSEGQQGQDQQGKEQQAKNQPGKDGQPQDQRQAKNEPSPGQEMPPQEQGQGQPQQPAPDQADKKRSGEVGAQGDRQPADAQQEAATEAEAAKEGKMTDAQARRLLESLRGEDKRVDLNAKEGKPKGRTFRDW
jgi:Ca-activated chloride channel family protein